MSSFFHRSHRLAALFTVAMLACTLLAACSSGAASVSSSLVAPSPSVSQPPPASSLPPPPPKDRDIDFTSLTKQNEDVVAWIEVPETVIDYPVVYSEDNTYYLNHDLDGNYYVGGSIFLDMANSRTVNDPMTVIYGHFMPDDTLFTQLHKYEDPAYFESNPTVKLFTPVNQFNYSVVAALTVDDRYVFYNMDTDAYIDYSSPEDVQYFLDWIAGTKDAAGNVNLEDCTVEDNYLVLSTCTQLANSNDRYIVVAKQESVL